MDHASVADEMPRAGPQTALPKPLPLPWLALSLVAIGLAAALVCSASAVLFIAWLVGESGRDGATDFIPAAEVRPTAAGPRRRRGGQRRLRRGWRSPPCSRPCCAADAAGATSSRCGGCVATWPVWRDVLGIAGLTLGYIASSTYAVEHVRDRSLLISGPTDVLLISTIVLNLVVFAPVAEELVFRGWLYTALRHRFSFWPSYLVTLGRFRGDPLGPAPSAHRAGAAARRCARPVGASAPARSSRRSPCIRSTISSSSPIRLAYT